MRTLWVSALISSALVLSGCTGMPVMTSTASTPANQVQGTALHGRVHGGNQPIVGASVYLYAVDATGYGKVSDSLLNSPGYVTTDSNGDFTITSDYSCPSASTQVYLYSVGGNPGAGGVNSAAGLLAGLGACGSLSSSTFVFMNEVSTIATAYSIAGYATDATHVSSSGSALAVTGVANALATIPNLESLSTGVALAATPSGTGTVPQSEIDTLANILAACINSTGSGSTNCTTLLGDAKNGSITPTDTATAAVNIAHNPGANVAALFGLQGSSPPFMPDLAAAPNDFTIGISFTNGNWLLNPTALAVDGSGNVWVGASGNPLAPEGGLGELLADTSWSSNTPIESDNIGYDDPAAIAISPVTTGNAYSSGDIWITVNGNGTELIQLSPSGSPFGGCASGCTETGLDGAYYLAFDSSGDGWQTSEEDYEGTNYLFLGVPGVGYDYYSGSCLTEGRGLAIDTSGNIWIANLESSGTSYNLCEFDSSGTQNSDSPFSGSGLTAYSVGAPVAIDASNNVWVGANGDVVKFNSSGVQQSPAGGYTGGGLGVTNAIAIDGAGNVWTAPGVNGNSISELNSSGTAISGSNGYTAGGIMSAVNNLAIDGSGNVWVTAASNIMVEFVGAAAPVVTPIAANLVTPYGSHAVNLP